MSTKPPRPSSKPSKPIKFAPSDGMHRSVTLSPKQHAVLHAAATAFALTPRGAYLTRRESYVMRYLLLQPKPTSLRPVLVSFLAEDWPLLVHILLVGGQSPTAGTPEMRYRTLYTHLLKRLPFRLK